MTGSRVLSPFWFYRKLKRSQAEKYPDSRSKSFTRQNFPDSKVFGFKVPTLDSGFKISGDTTKPGRFYVGFVTNFKFLRELDRAENDVNGSLV